MPVWMWVVIVLVWYLTEFIAYRIGHRHGKEAGYIEGRSYKG